MNAKEFEKLNAKLTQIFESCGQGYPPLDEKERWLQNYKNPNPKFRLYKIDKESFEKYFKNFRDPLPEFKEFSTKELDDFYATLFKKTKYYSLGHVAIDYFKNKQKKKNPELIKDWPKLKTWVTRIDNWAHADMIASLYCDMLTEDPKTVLPVLEKWASEKSPWKNRMGIVSLLYYYNPKRYKPPYKTIEKMIKPHLGKDHYYLQKAIGWNLREVSTAYPKEFKAFMNKNLHQISSTAYSTAVEKTDKQTKDAWKRARKEGRKKA